MWPFKTVQQKIDDLEEKIAGGLAYIKSSDESWGRLGRVNIFDIHGRAEMMQKIAIWKTRLETLKVRHTPYLPPQGEQK